MKLLTVLFIGLLCALAMPALADDVGLIQINSQAQVETAQTLLGYAYAKVDDRFLVLATPDQQSALAAAGITFEPVVHDADIHSLYLVHPRRPGVSLDGVDRLGVATRLGDHLAVVEAGVSAAAATRDEGLYFVRALSDLKVIFHYSGAQVAHPLDIATTYPTDTLVNKVRRDSIYAYDTRLEAFRTRYIWTDSCLKARDWLKQKFLSWGYTNVTTPTFTYSGGTFYNVKAVKLGYAEPDKIIVIGGHYDSWDQESPGPMTYAPGADDNASGTTVALEVARVLANMPLRKTVIFMPFSAEEEGLIGSQAAAIDFRTSGANLEAMFNYDMVGYVENLPWRISLASGNITAYRQLSADAATRLTSLVPVITPMGSSSDHASFDQQGFNICDNIETDFNNAGWHTNLDLSSRMNFDYFTEVVKMAVASVAIAANSASVVTVNKIIDQGDGQSLQIFWNPCTPSYEFTVYWGPGPGAYTDSVHVPAGQCSQMITGLAQNMRYFFGVYGKPSDGYRSITAIEGSEVPMLEPRAPNSPAAEPGDHNVLLSWRPNKEADFSHYRVYRKLHEVGDFSLWVDNVSDTTLTDAAVQANVLYDYKIAAVDLAGHESAFSATVSSYPGTFDGGVLIADEFVQDYDQFPTQAHQEAYWDSVFGATTFAVKQLNTHPDMLDKGSLGTYSSIFWIDDDVFNKLIKDSDPTLKWYLTKPTNLFICGYKTLQSWVSSPIPTNHTLYTDFKISSYKYTSLDHFVGAVGDNGWPSVQFDQYRGFWDLTEIPVLTVQPGGTVILRYDSYNNRAGYEGEPCGVAYNGPNGKRIILSFPLYYLTEASAASLINKALIYFGETSAVTKPGDINGSGVMDLVDLTFLIGYLVGQVPSLPNPNGGDVDGSCVINLVDLTLMVNYLVLGYPAPVPGCVIPGQQ